MTQMKLFGVTLSTLLATGLLAQPAQAFMPRGVVSTEWVESHLQRPNVVVVDVRAPEQYALGHVPGAVNVPFEMPVSAWVSLGAGGLLMEAPTQAELFAAIGAAGISWYSSVVVVGATAAEGVPAAYPLAQTARVADTLIYAGVRNVTILDGGINKWAAEGRTLSSETVVPTPVTYYGWMKTSMFVSKDDVLDALYDGDTLLLDNRDAEVYDGTIIEPYAPIAGHIPGAASLPTPLIWNEDGTYKSVRELRAMAVAAGANCPWEKVVVYCGVGGYASGWWFVLTQMLGFRNVGFYDGSSQEWTAEPAGPMEVE